jgi:hypothetical protein
VKGAQSPVRLVLGAWLATVTTVLLVAPLAAPHRWPPAYWVGCGTQLVEWLCIAACAWRHFRRSDLRTRAIRQLFAAAIAALGTVFMAAAVTGPTTSGRRTVGTLALAAAAALAGWLLGRAGPEQLAAPPSPDHQGSPRTTTVWVRRATNNTPLLAATASALAYTALRPPSISALATITAVLSLLAATSTVRLIADATGLTIGYGPFNWPSRTIPTTVITHARVEVRRPREVGGWGHQGTYDNLTIMVRSGECLVLELSDGRRFAVTIDDAATAARLLGSHHRQLPGSRPLNARPRGLRKRSERRPGPRTIRRPRCRALAPRG